MLSEALRRSSTLALLLLAPVASAGILYVDDDLTTGLNDGSSWADAFQGPDALQTALGAVVAGDQIFVAEGTYLPSATGTRTNRFLLHNDVEIYGSFLGTESSPAERPPFGTAPSVLLGDLAGDDGSNMFNDNSYHLLGGNGTNASAVLDGFVVTGGNANGAGNNDKGGGILLLNGASPTVRNCRFVGNRCTFGGGAGYINGSAPSFTDCTFEDNLGGAFGGAFDIANAGAVRFDRCLFEGNSAARAGALEVFSSNGVVVTNSVFRGNTATGASGGGGLWIGSGSNTLLRYCTVVDNHATNQTAGGLRVQSASPTIVGVIFWDNSGSGGAQGSANQVTGSANVTYSIVEGGFTGTGNLSGDPQFTDIGAGDYSLTIASPGIDAGDNSAVPAGIVLDFAQNARFIDEPGVADTGNGSAPIVDIGAFEFQGAQGGVGTNYCTSSANSTGAAATISASGSASLAANDLVLSADNHPGQPGIFIAGPAQAQLPFFNGFLCIDPNGLQRFAAVALPVGGVATEAVDYATSAPGGLNVMAGTAFHYQRWFRDPAAGGSNADFTDGLEVQHTP